MVSPQYGLGACFRNVSRLGDVVDLALHLTDTLHDADHIPPHDVVFAGNKTA